MVTALKSSNQNILHKSKDIVKDFFCLFYQFLYSLENPSNIDISNFLDKTGFGKRPTTAHKAFLDSPITESEMFLAMSKLKTNKATGHDGIPAEFYRTFKDLLLKPFLDTCNNLLVTGNKPKTWNVFPKPGREKLVVGSYRPISLLNHDAKLFTSVLARCLINLILEYIHTDQTGFVPNRHLGDNV